MIGQQKEKNFKFIFDTSWDEKETLYHFRIEILKDPLLYSNNLFKNQKPIKQVNSFKELHPYIQAFNFRDEHFPIYYPIAVALESCFRCSYPIKGIVYFQAKWIVDNSTNDYFALHELPKDYNIFWDYVIEKELTLDQVRIKYNI